MDTTTNWWKKILSANGIFTHCVPGTVQLAIPMVLLRSGTDRWLVAELIFVSFSTCRLSPFFSELLNRYCNSSRKEKAGERTCSRPQGSYISLAAGAFYKMFSYKQFNFATGTTASLFRLFTVRLESALWRNRWKNMKVFFKRLVLATPTRVELLIITYYTTLIFYYYLLIS